MKKLLALLLLAVLALGAGALAEVVSPDVEPPVAEADGTLWTGDMEIASDAAGAGVLANAKQIVPQAQMAGYVPITPSVFPDSALRDHLADRSNYISELGVPLCPVNLGVLDVSGTKVRDMTGVNRITGLRVLNCKGRGLALNLNGLALQELICSDNVSVVYRGPGIAELIADGLDYLDLDGTSIIKRMSVRAGEVSCQDCRIDELVVDFAGKLNCNGATVGRLALQGPVNAFSHVNAELSEVVTRAWLPQLDLTDVDLKTLVVEDYAGDIDCSGNTGVQSLTVVNGATSLAFARGAAKEVTLYGEFDKVDCSGSRIGTLILEGDAKTVDCQGSTITGMNTYGALGELWCADASMTRLSLHGTGGNLACDCSSIQTLELGSEDEPLNADYVYAMDSNIPTIRQYGRIFELRATNGTLSRLTSGGFIENLLCGGNALTTLNVRCGSLSCEGNKLKTLKATVTGDYVNCSDNQMTKLTVKGDKLAYLYCANNKLKSLKQSWKKLKALDCSNNRLTKLTLSGKKLAWLDCSGNAKLKKVDLKNCPKLKDYVKCWAAAISNGRVEWWGDAQSAAGTAKGSALSGSSGIRVDAATRLVNGTKTLYKSTKPTKVSFSQVSVTLKKGKSYDLVSKLGMKMKATGAVSTCKFTAKKKGVVTVSKGRIKAVARGTTKLTVRTANGKKATIVVKVK